MRAIAKAVIQSKVMEYLPQLRIMVRLLSRKDKCPLVGFSFGAEVAMATLRGRPRFFIGIYFFNKE